MESIYFSKNNAILLFNIIQKKILKETGYDINTQRQKYGTDLTNIMESVYKNKNTLNIPTSTSPLDVSKILSQKVINTATVYFKDAIVKNTGVIRSTTVDQSLTRDLDSRVSGPNRLSDRPASSDEYHPLDNVNNHFEKMRKEREEPKGTPMPNITFTEKNAFVNNLDVSAKFTEMSSMRDMSSVSMKPASVSFSSISSTETPIINTATHPSIVPVAVPSKITGESLDAQFTLLTDIKGTNQYEKQFKDPVLSTDEFSKRMEMVQKQRNMITSDRTYTSTSLEGMEDFGETEGLISSTPITLTMEPKVRVPGGVLSSMPIEDNKEVVDMEKTVNKTEIYEPVGSSQVNKSDMVLMNDTIMKTRDMMDKMFSTILNLEKVMSRQATQPLTIRTYNLIISSGDRAVNQPLFNKYNFRVEFSPGGDMSATNYDLRNPGEGNSNFDRTSTTFTSVGARNPYLQRIFKNISSIKLQRMILPKPVSDNFYSEPYLLLAIDEINSNIYTTKTINKNLFAKMHYDKENTFGSSGAYRSYLHYLNNDDDYQIFYPTPLAKLDRLTLNLLSSDGNQLGDIYRDSDIGRISGWNGVSILTLNASSDVDNLYVIGDRITFTEFPSYTGRISSINSGANNIILDVTNFPIPSGFNLTSNGYVINITNQIQYIFQVKVEEPDALTPLRGDLI